MKKLFIGKKNFLSDILHDLRIPLAVVRGYTKTLLTERNGVIAEQNGWIKLVLSKVVQVEKLVKQFFELSKNGISPL